MTPTTFKINNCNINYKILKNGYEIYMDDKLWISQLEPYIPFKDLSYEESCLKQLAELFNANNVEDNDNPDESNLSEVIVGLIEESL